MRGSVPAAPFAATMRSVSWSGRGLEGLQPMRQTLDGGTGLSPTWER